MRTNAQQYDYVISSLLSILATIMSYFDLLHEVRLPKRVQDAGAYWSGLQSAFVFCCTSSHELNLPVQDADA